MVWHHKSNIDQINMYMKGRGGDFFYSMVERVWWGIQRNSPMDTGRFRASWEISLGKPIIKDVGESYKMESEAALDVLARDKLNAIKDDIKKMEQTVWIANGVPYATLIEQDKKVLWNVVQGIDIVFEPVGGDGVVVKLSP